MADDLDARVEAAWAALQACTGGLEQGASPDDHPEYKALLDAWYVVHCELDERGMDRMMGFLKEVWRDPCPVCGWDGGAVKGIGPKRRKLKKAALSSKSLS